MSPTERQQRDRLDAAFGAWIRERLAAQKPDRWTQQRLRDELAQRGYEVKREWLNQVIGGKHAGDDLRRAIEALLGEFSEPTGGLHATPDALVEALRAQTEALTLLAEQIRLSRAEEAIAREEMMKALGAALAPRGTQAGAGRDTPAGAPR